MKHTPGPWHIHANTNHFFKAYEHCLNCKFSAQHALIMSRGFAARGLIDAAEGCAHYALAVIGIKAAIAKATRKEAAL